MPLYEYECDSCKHRFERIQKYSDPLADTCPECGGTVRKLVSSPAFQFKGTGWYVTDYARKDQTAGKETKGTPAGEESGKSDAAPSSSGETKGSDAKKDSSSDSSSKTNSSSSTNSSKKGGDSSSSSSSKSS